MGSSFRKDVLKAAAAYFILISAVYAPVIFYNKTLSFAARYPWFTSAPPSDDQTHLSAYPNTYNVDIAAPAALEEPIDVFIGKQLRRGIFPMWNPFIAAGNFVQEEFATRTLFPYQLLQCLCPWEWRDFFLLGRLLFAALGAFIFLWFLGAGFYPSFCGGLIYGFSGAMTIFLDFTELSNVGMALPYALIGAELLYRRCNAFSVAACSMATGMLILAGQPESAFYGMLLLCAYYIFRVMTGGDQPGTAGKKIGIFFISMLAALVISLPFFIPFIVNGKLCYTLHAPGGTMGVETPTRVTNFMAIIFPKLLEWPIRMASFTLNYGWDCLGGYVGIAAVFLICAAYGKKWQGRKNYLFFLWFTVFIFLKNMGMPFVSWIGLLPVFNQVWTPRWAGPVWSLSLATAAGLAFQALIPESKGEEERGDNGSVPAPGNRWTCCLLIMSGVFLLSIGLLANPDLLPFLRDLTTRNKYISPTVIFNLKIFFVAMGWLALFNAAKHMRLSSLFIIFVSVLILSAFNFESQLAHIDSFPERLQHIGNKAVLFSMWQGIMETVVSGLLLLLALSLVLRQGIRKNNNLAVIVTGIIVVEMAFHAAIGYDKSGRLARLAIHIAMLLILISYSLRYKTIRREVFVIAACFFIVGMLWVGTFGKACMPDRGTVFKRPPVNIASNDVSRVMGIKGVMFPNLSAAIGVQDIKSIVSISIKRFQLFQDHCLLIRPQSKYKGLWFTGITDPKMNKGISEHIQKRHAYYSLAGVANYLSPDYENIPQTELIQDGPVKNYKNLAVMPRSFIVHKWSPAGTPQDSLIWMLLQSSFDSEAVVEGADIPSAAEITDAPHSSAKITAYDLHSVVIDAQADAPGLLVLTDTYYPSWIAKVDGKEEKVFPVDLCFRGVFLSPGRHKVEFIYRPKIFFACVAASAAAMLALFVAASLYFVNKHRRAG